ncbi:MAG: hypothetical protein KOO60_11615 [Gemmatimonadales bacterium]|nr:hypothetical protein [Gemmatimonadales bacterium]
MAAFILSGCTSKEDPAESLAVCGNHACGDLVMVTADTSSEGFHYLNPSLSPDGNQILFTADWTAIPADDKYNEDDWHTNHRQMALIPLQERFEPEKSLRDQGAVLLRLREMSIPKFAGMGEHLNQAINDRKGDPIWEEQNSEEGNTHIIFRLELSRGYRLFRAEISNPDLCDLTPLYLEPADSLSSGMYYQHFEPALSPDGNWLAFTRSSCLIPDSLETCTQIELMVLEMETAGENFGYEARAFPVTSQSSRIERPNWSRDGRKIVFSSGLDMAGETGWGTELFTIDFDPDSAAEEDPILDNNLNRLTFTDYRDGDPIVGISNTSPFYSHDGSEIFFVSSRRLPTTTHHDRNIWKIPADGSLDPEVYFFTRSDDVDASLNPDGSLLVSSQLGFTTEILIQLEEEAYQRAKQLQGDELTILELRTLASDERHVLEMFEDVMSHLYVFRK